MLTDRREHAGLPDPVEQQHRQSNKTEIGERRKGARFGELPLQIRCEFSASAKNLAGLFTLSDGYWAAAAAVW